MSDGLVIVVRVVIIISLRVYNNRRRGEQYAGSHTVDNFNRECHLQKFSLRLSVVAEPLEHIAAGDDIGNGYQQPQ